MDIKNCRMILNEVEEQHKELMILRTAKKTFAGILAMDNGRDAQRAAKEFGGLGKVRELHWLTNRRADRVLGKIVDLQNAMQDALQV